MPLGILLALMLTNQPSDRPPMVCEFKFVCYGHIKKNLALYVTQFKFDGPLESEVSFLQIVKSWDFSILKIRIRNLFWL